MNDDLISRKDVLDYIDSMPFEVTEDGYYMIRRVRLTEYITDTLPSAERKKGRWQEDPSGYGFWICSACGFVSEASGADLLYNFCPNCGADMRAGEGERDETD